MPTLTQITIGVIISVFWSTPAIGNISISIDTKPTSNDFGKSETQYHVFMYYNEYWEDALW